MPPTGAATAGLRGVLLSGEAIPKVAASLSEIGRLHPGLVPNPLALDADATAALEKAGRPTGVMAQRRRELLGSKEAELAADAAKELATYAGIAERLLPAPDAGALERVRAELAEGGVAGRRRREVGRAAGHPVKTVEEPRLLRPVVHRLIVRGGGDGGYDEVDTRRWAAVVSQSLAAEPCLVPAGA
jgi:hypothetical protein